jgi:hypothetical protein
MRPVHIILILCVIGLGSLAPLARAETVIEFDPATARTDGKPVEGAIQYKLTVSDPLSPGTVNLTSSEPKFTLSRSLKIGETLCATATENHGGYSVESEKSCITMRSAPAPPEWRSITVKR